MVKRILATCFAGWLLLTSPTHADETIPATIHACIEQATKEIMLASDRTAAWQVFTRYVDATKLGSRTYGGLAWRNFTQEERAMGLKLFFDLIYSDGQSITEGVRDINNSVINYRAAERPVVKASQGLHHLVVSARLDNGKRVAGAVILTESCKLVDIGQGGFASRFLDANDVDAAMRLR